MGIEIVLVFLFALFIIGSLLFYLHAFLSLLLFKRKEKLKGGDL